MNNQESLFGKKENKTRGEEPVSFFDVDDNSVEYKPKVLMGKNERHEHWIDMPEYNNVAEPDALITATFKFKSQEDFELFNTLAKKHVYKCNKIFDGTQRKDKKQAWFPLKDKGANYEYQ